MNFISSCNMELHELKKNLEELGTINEKQEKRVRYQSTRAQVLTVSYFIFQALIYLSTSHTTIQCKNWWIPFTLSLLSFMLFFFAFLDSVTNYYRLQYHLDLNHIEQQILVSQIHSAQYRSKHVGDGDGDGDGGGRRMRHEVLKPDEVQLLKRKVCIGFVIFALVAFAVVILFACRAILCDGESVLEVGVSDHV